MKVRIVLAVCILTNMAACQRERHEPRAVQPAAASEAQPSATKRAIETDALSQVSDRSLVCMVNDQFMGRPQIPVTVDGRVYYGCREMCEGRLANDPASRSAKDPVSGRAIDKSVAVIGRTDTGATLYFENQANFVAYAKKPRVP